MRKLLKRFGLGMVVLAIVVALPRWLGPIGSVALGFLIIAISIVFVAVLSKAYKDWPV